eukprot:Protomagalhaensia_sp_Gyna_25__482@NODE_1228_length_2047_cov_6_000498_g979_i0_p1_GENE_NODE_1228_length_2047_cov_6_000498_g979_i0NODE_1228_length_2047_cov_6_000498_g979_i0_p1_ORF_typecomplete_len246_score25_42PALP/PF00291_25/1_1e20_NODE_1228_length_2047_cov_6_000498_g979_i07321469
MAVNSVNFARIICQMVYFLYAAYVDSHSHSDHMSVCVPTGNFGNVLAAWYCSRMGAPISRLVIASNINDILPRFYQTGEYRLKHVVPTITPSIDIALSSNFERLIQFYCDCSTADLYRSLAREGSFTVDAACKEAFRKEFYAESVTESETLSTIKQWYKKQQYLMDPHTAVAFHAAEMYMKATGSCNVLIVSTAHPAKFPDVIDKAVGQNILQIPEDIQALKTMQEHHTVAPPLLDAIKSIIASF